MPGGPEPGRTCRDTPSPRDDRGARAAPRDHGSRRPPRVRRTSAIHGARERLRADARDPVDRVLEHPGHRGVVFETRYHERVAAGDAISKLLRARRKAVLDLRSALYDGASKSAIAARSTSLPLAFTVCAASSANRVFSDPPRSAAEKIKKRPVRGRRPCSWLRS